jgi:hypothetical protein
MYLILGCSGQFEGGQSSVVRDSAGIRIVENFEPAWQEGDSWRLGEEPVVDIGGLEGDPNYELYRVSAAVRLADGRIVVANSGTQELRFFDKDGRFLSLSGRQGGGPGEFQFLAWVQRYRGDSLIAFDQQSRRASTFDTDGMFGRSMLIEAPPGTSIGHVVSAFADGTLLVRGLSAIPSRPSQGLFRPPLRFFHYTSEGSFIDTTGIFLNVEVFRSGSGVTVIAPAYARNTTVATSGDLLYVGNNEEFEIRVFALDRSLRSLIRKKHEGVAVTAADVAEANEQRLAGMPSGGFRGFRDALDRAPIPDTYPSYGKILLDDVGNLWVSAPTAMPTDLSSRWTVFDTDGRWLGAVDIPDRFLILQIGNDFLLGRWEGELDVEHVQVYDLIKP